MVRSQEISGHLDSGLGAGSSRLGGRGVLVGWWDAWESFHPADILVLYDLPIRYERRLVCSLAPLYKPSHRADTYCYRETKQWHLSAAGASIPAAAAGAGLHIAPQSISSLPARTSFVRRRRSNRLIAAADDDDDDDETAGRARPIRRRCCFTFILISSSDPKQPSGLATTSSHLLDEKNSHTYIALRCERCLRLGRPRRGGRRQH